MAVAGADVFHGLAQFLDGLEVANSVQLSVERFEEAFDAATTFRFTDKCRCGLDSPKSLLATWT